MTNTLRLPVERFDLRFATEPASSYYLIVHIDKHALNVCWYNRIRHLITGMAAYPLDGSDLPSEVTAVLNGYPMLHGDFLQTIVTVHCDNYAWVPRLVPPSDGPEMFRLCNTRDEKTTELLRHEMVSVPASLFYALPTGLLDYVRRNFTNAQCVPHVAPLVEYVVKSNHRSEAIHVHLSGDRMDLIAARNGVLLLANSFYQCAPEDVAYYALYCAEILDTDPEKVPLSLSGSVSLDDEVFTLLGRYWNNAFLMPHSQAIPVSEQVATYPVGPFGHLSHALLCAS